MDGATVLCTKNTFVDVEATEEASGSCAQERPQSAPPLLWTPESPSSANERCLTPEPVYDAARVSSVPCPIPLPFLGASTTVLCIKNTFVHVEGTEEAFGSCSQERPQTVPPLLSTPESLSSANEGGLTPVLVVARVSSVSVPIPLSFLVAPSAMPAAVFEPIPNVGSLAHTRGTCRPCAFWHKPLGCRDGFLCCACSAITARMASTIVGKGVKPWWLLPCKKVAKRRRFGRSWDSNATKFGNMLARLVE